MRGSRLPARKRGTSNAGNSDSRVCAPLVPSVRRSWDGGPRGQRQRLRNREGVQPLEVVRRLRQTPDQIHRDTLTVFHHRNLDGFLFRSACLTLALGLLLPGFPAVPLLPALFCLQTGLFGSDGFMRNDAEPRRQSLLPTLFFSLFGLEINVIRI